MTDFFEFCEGFKDALLRRADRIREQQSKSRGSLEEEERALRSNKRKRSATNAKTYTTSGSSAEVLDAAGPPLLTGWKEISQALGSVSVRTAQRWEKTVGLPVGRVGSTPVADPEEIKAWKKRSISRHSR